MIPMNKFIKTSFILIIVFLTFSLIGCQEEPAVADEYTVEFVDFDGTVLETYTCHVGVACNIVAPTVPDQLDPNYKENSYF